MLVINLYGNSCSGKSGHSARIFAELKKLGLNVEYARESCKGWFYDGRQYKLDNQYLITGKMVEQLELFKQGGCDIVVTDSPILMGAIYTTAYQTDISLAHSIRVKHHTYNNFNILLESDVEFNPHGRGSGNANRDKVFQLLMQEGLAFDYQSKTSELTSYKVLVNKILRRLDGKSN